MAVTIRRANTASPILLVLSLLSWLNVMSGYVNLYTNCRFATTSTFISSPTIMSSSFLFATTPNSASSPTLPKKDDIPITKEKLTTSSNQDKMQQQQRQQQQQQQNDSRSSSSSAYQYSLAGKFLVVTKTVSQNSYEWLLVPIGKATDFIDETVVEACQKSESALSWAALHHCFTKHEQQQQQPIENLATIRLTSKIITKSSSHSSSSSKSEIQTTMERFVGSNSISKNYDPQLLEVLARIMVQWTAKQYSMGEENTFSDQVMLSFVNTINEDCDRNDSVNIVVSSSMLLSVEDNKDNIESIADSNLFSMDTSKSEMVEMVDRQGKCLGCVPRKLVHKYNLLHRGIGMFVTRHKPIQLQGKEGEQHQNQPYLYVHQRSHDKSIFPAFYDMFVGGVSLAGEDSILTARREVAEELGLIRALDDEKSLKQLTGPILHCIVCTAYNRCYVDLYSYTIFDTDMETISWQPEEVAWGVFVPYNIICAAADQSIQRLVARNEWPGRYPPIQSELNGNIIVAKSRSSEQQQHEQYDETEEEQDYENWDFVPDGLLVWEAWLRRGEET